MRPPPNRSAWQWAEAERVLPKGTAEPGKYRSARTPWIVPITDAVSDYHYSTVISITGSQSGKTDGILLNVLGHRMMDNPAPAILYMPTEISARSIAKDRLAKMFKNSKGLTDALDKKGNTTLEMFIGGVRLGIGWGGSATQVSSHPAALVLFDEIDRLKDIPGEGSPWHLTKVRGITYPDFTQVGTTTVTTGRVGEYTHPDTGLIHWERSTMLESLGWRLWQDGTCHEFMIPCPECQTYFTPKSKLLVFDENWTTSQIEKETGLRCPHCGAFIDQRHQHQLTTELGRMIAPGQWVEDGNVCGEVAENNIYSAFVNGLCSDFVTWGQRAASLHRSKQSGKVGEIQSVLNTEFGELYYVAGIAPMWQQLKRLRGHHEQTDIPTAIKILTLTVDVQKNRLVYVLCGWAMKKKPDLYICDYGEIIGDSRQEEVWEDLEEMMLVRYDDLPISHIVVDASYNPSADYDKQKDAKPISKNLNIIYQFGRRNRSKVLLIKGSPRPMDKLWTYNMVDVNHDGKIYKAGVGLYTVNTDAFKQDLYAWFDRGIETPEKDRKLYLPENVEDEFLKQITSEERKRQSGKDVWVKNYENHYLDCLMMQLFLFDAKKLKSRLKSMKAPIRQPQIANKAQEAPAAEKREAPQQVVYEGQVDTEYLGDLA